MKFLEAALISGVILAVICFGGTETISFAAVEILFLAMAAWLAIKPDHTSGALRPAHLVVPALLLAIGLLQLCPLPEGLFRLLGAPRNSHGGSHWEALSLAPYQTRSELLVLLTCVVTFILAILVSAERSRKRRVIYCLVMLGVGEAFYGLIQYLANWQNIFWYAKRYDLQEATGTYINRNHFAGLLEMVLPFAVCLALYEGERATSSGKHRSRRPKGFNPSLPKAVLWLGASVVVVAAIVFSRSRMGLLCACASLIVVLGLNALQRKAVPVALTAAFLILSLSFAAWIGLRPALNRFENVGQELSGQQESRLSVWPGTLKVICERPLIGSGLGAFPIAYTAFQSTFLTKFMNHAHNDYLELSADLGVPAAVALFASIVWVLSRGIRTFFRAASRFERDISLACVGSIAAIVLHSLTDFNLYIPANALVLALILGITLASASEISSAEAVA
jgi:O-antigen ligase